MSEELDTEAVVEMIAELQVTAKKAHKALRALAERVTALTEEVAVLRASLAEQGASPSTPAEPSTGVFVPRDTCHVCDNVKGPGREKHLMCKPCGVERNEALRGKITPRTFRLCTNCQAIKNTSSQLLCSPCRKSFKNYTEGRTADV